MKQKSTTKSLVRQFLFRLLLMASLLVTMSVMLIGYDSMQQQSDLVYEADKNINVFGGYLASDIELALGHEIPLSEMVGVTPYFEDAFERFPRIENLWIVGLNGHILFETGNKNKRISDFAKKVSSLSFQDVPPVNVNDLRISVLPLALRDGSLAGGLMIGTREISSGLFATSPLAEFLIVLILSLFILAEIFLLINGPHVIYGVRRCQKMMASISVGDFRHCLDPLPQNEVGDFADALNDVIDGVNAHYHKMQSQVDLIKQGAGEDAQLLRKRLGAHISQLLNRIHFAEVKTKLMPMERSPTDLRAPLFLFAFAEAMAAPFFPQYVITLSDPIEGMDKSMLVGIPIALFFACLLIVTPVILYLSNRMIQKHLLVVGSVLATIGFVGTALVDNYTGMLLWRSISAAAYALIITSFQNALQHMSAKDDWTKALAFSLIVSVTGAGCGVVFGGLLANLLMYSEVYLASASITLFGGLLVALFMVKQTTPANLNFSKPSLLDRLGLLGNMRFMAMVVFGAMPVKLALTGVLLLIVPLFLGDMGLTPESIALVMVVYFAILAAATPLFAWLAEKAALSLIPVFFGALFTCSGFLVLYQWHDVTAVAVAIFGLAVGHAMTTTPLLSLLPLVCEQEIETLGPVTVLTTFRTLENIGGIAGPLVAALLVSHFGFSHAIVLMGLIVLAGALLLSLLFMSVGTSQNTDNTKVA